MRFSTPRTSGTLITKTTIASRALLGVPYRMLGGLAEQRRDDDYADDDHNRSSDQKPVRPSHFNI